MHEALNQSFCGGIAFVKAAQLRCIETGEGGEGEGGEGEGEGGRGGRYLD